MNDPRPDLERLPSENLFEVARNEAATHRLLAIEILVERASPFVGREEIVNESRQFVLSNPIILKKIDPASATFAPQLPGVVDCLADVLTKHNELGRVVGENHAAHNQNHIVHAEKIAELGSMMNENQTATAQAIAEAYATLWRDYTEKVFQLKVDHDSQLTELRAEHEKDITAATERLALLERSTWRKLVDYLKSVKRNLVARYTLSSTDPPAST